MLSAARCFFGGGHRDIATETPETPMTASAALGAGSQTPPSNDTPPSVHESISSDPMGDIHESLSEEARLGLGHGPNFLEGDREDFDEEGARYETARALLDDEDDGLMVEGGTYFDVLEGLWEFDAVPGPPDLHEEMVVCDDGEVTLKADGVAAALEERLHTAVSELHDRFDVANRKLSKDDVLKELVDTFLGPSSPFFTALLKGLPQVEDCAQLEKFLATFCYLSAAGSSAAQVYNDPYRNMEDFVTLDEWNTVWRNLQRAQNDLGEPIWYGLEHNLNDALKQFHTTKMTPGLDDEKPDFHEGGRHDGSELKPEFHVMARRPGFTGHIANDNATNLPLAVRIQRFGETIGQCFGTVLEMLAVGSHSHRFENLVVAVDRAYQFKVIRKAVVDAGGNIFGTAKRTEGMVFTHGKTTTRNVNQIVISEQGASAMYEARGKDNKARAEMAWRTGTGKAILLRQDCAPFHSLKVSPGAFELAKAKVPTRTHGTTTETVTDEFDRSYAEEPDVRDAPPGRVSEEDASVLRCLGIRAITEAGVQYGVVWKQGRGAAFTSTSAAAIISILQGEYEEGALPKHVTRAFSSSVLRAVSAKQVVQGSDASKPDVVGENYGSRANESASSTGEDISEQDCGSGSETDGSDGDASLSSQSVDSDSGNDMADDANNLLRQDVKLSLSDAELDKMDKQMLLALCEQADGAKSFKQNAARPAIIKELKTWRDTEPAARLFLHMTNFQLNAWIRESGHHPQKMPTRKDELMNVAILLHKGELIPVGERRKTIEDAVVQSWLITAVDSKAKLAMLAGIRAEPALARKLRENGVTRGPHEEKVCSVIRVGLVHQEGKMYLKDSPDRILIVQDHNQQRRAIVAEIKTRVQPEPQRKAVENRESVAKMKQVDQKTSAFYIDTEKEGFEAFHAVADHGERVQMIHHLAVLRLRECIFVIGRPTSQEGAAVISTYWFKFSDDLIDQYCVVLQYAYERGLKWFYEGEGIPDTILEAALRHKNTVDEHTFKQRVSLQKALHGLLDTRAPLPNSQFFLPSIVAMWNALKGPVDKMTQLCNGHTTTLAPSITSPQAMIVQRLLLYLLYGIFRAQQVLTAKNFKRQSLSKFRSTNDERISMSSALLDIARLLLARSNAAVKEEGDTTLQSHVARASRGAELVEYSGQVNTDMCPGGAVLPLHRLNDQNKSVKAKCNECERHATAGWYCFGCRTAYCSPTNHVSHPNEAERDRDILQYVQIEVGGKGTQRLIPNSCFLSKHKHLFPDRTIDSQQDVTQDRHSAIGTKSKPKGLRKKAAKRGRR